MTNPFEALAEAQTPRPVKARQQAAAKAAATRANKAQEEEDRILLSQFLAHQRGERESLLAGPVGAEVKGLLSFARTMTLQSAPELIERVARAEWIKTMSVDDKFVLLRVINTAIVNLRIRNGLSPLEDALWDQAPRAFHTLKTIMGLDGK
jgi:hypothetical protein